MFKAQQGAAGKLELPVSQSRAWQTPELGSIAPPIFMSPIFMSPMGANAAAPATHLLLAWLMGSNTTHRGVFHELAIARGRSIAEMVHNMLMLHRPRLARTGPLHYHIIHEMPPSWRPSALYGIARLLGNVTLTVHRLDRSQEAAAANMPPNDVRWLAYDVALREARVPSDACVFAIDFGDVGVIGNPSSLCASGRLAVSTDSCRTKGVKQWLSGVARQAEYTPSSPQLEAFLADPTAPLLNCGIVGGMRHVFDPFLQRLTRAIVRHHRSWLERSSASWRQGLHVGTARAANETGLSMSSSVPVDMLALNDVVAADEYEGARVLRGFPIGPVNLPFWGDVCGSNCTELDCKLDELARMMPNYVFSHKVKFPWGRFFSSSPIEHAQQRAREGSSQTSRRMMRRYKA